MNQSTSSPLSADRFERIIETIRKHYPGWQSVNDPRMQADEQEYKRKAVAKAEELLHVDEYQRLLEVKDFGEIITRLKKVAAAANLQRWNERALLDLKGVNAEDVATEMFDFLHGSDDIETRTRRWVEFVSTKSQPNFWTFHTYYLFLLHPTTEFFVKPDATFDFLTFLGAEDRYATPPTAESYMAIREIMQDLLDALRPFGATDMIDVQSVVWVWAKARLQTFDSQIWILAAGQDAAQWDMFKRENLVAIDWGSLGDLKSYDSQEEMIAALTVPGKPAPVHDSLACWQFAHMMKPGDVVLAKQGGFKVLGIGVVTGDYVFNRDRPGFNHIRPVEWLHEGPWTLPESKKMALKTLTNMTLQTSFLNSVKAVTGVDPTDLSQVQTATRRYWWLNFNPSIWSIRQQPLGETQSYTSYNEAGNKRQIYKHFGEVREGDLIIGYESSPVMKVVALCRVTEPLHNRDGQEQFSFTKVEDAPVPLSWRELQVLNDLQEGKLLTGIQGSLFKLTEDAFRFIAGMARFSGYPLPALTRPIYTLDHALTGLFMTRPELEHLISLFRARKNLILQGPPGVGKTFVAKRLAYALMGFKAPERVGMVQFHQSYAYEDFIQGYRPTETGGFALKNGVFYDFCRRAASDPDNDYVFIIDEINRGNLSKIFGELMMLVEHDKRGKDWAMPLTYSDGVEEPFYVPENLFLLGMMNTADRSLAMVDYALRRRFAFVDLKPKFDGEQFRMFMEERNVETSMVERIISRMTELNARIEADKTNLGSGFSIGHSFFCPGSGTVADDVWYRRVIDTEIAPLVREYWFDDAASADKLIEELLR